MAGIIMERINKIEEIKIIFAMGIIYTIGIQFVELWERFLWGTTFILLILVGYWLESKQKNKQLNKNNGGI